MSPAAQARIDAGKLPYEPGGRQATKNDILNIAWMLGMPLDERAPVGGLVEDLLHRVKYMREALERVRDRTGDPALRDLARLVLQSSGGGETRHV